MTRTRTSALAAVVLVVILGVPSGYGAADIDRTAVDIRTRPRSNGSRTPPERTNQPCFSETRASPAPTSCA